MKLAHLLPIALLALTACTSDPAQSPSGTGQETTHTPLPPTDTLPKAGSPQPATDAEPLEAVVERYAGQVLGAEYKAVGLDQLEDTPKLKAATGMAFRKFIRREPIKNQFAGAVIPRMVWKGYRFKDQAALTAALEEWLNGSEHSGDSIRLGVEVEAIKTPPIVCAVVGSELHMMQVPCFYKGPEQEEVVTRFMAEMAKAGATHRFRIGCNGGQLAYVK